MVAAGAGAVVRESFLGITSFKQCVGESGAVVGARSAFEIGSGLAQRTAGIDDRCDRADRLPADARRISGRYSAKK
jgi:hypothetical protein